MAVLVLHNIPAAAAADGFAWAESEAGVLNAVRHVSAALLAAGIPCRTAGVSRLDDVPRALAAGHEEVVFNLVERLEGSGDDCNLVPAVCQALGRGCTGGDTPALLLTQDKHLTKARLAAHGIRVPAGVVVPVGAALPAELPSLPLFVKPLASDGSEGIAALSLVREGAGQLAAAIAHVHRTCRQPALVESFIDGREFNLAVMGAGTVPQPLPVAEIDFSLFPAGRAHVVDYDLKWHPGVLAGHTTPRRIPAAVDPAQAAELGALAQRVWQACCCRDYARVDCRMDARGHVYVLEVNVNCDLSPLAGFAQALQVAGIPFARFVALLVDNARRRVRL